MTEAFKRGYMDKLAEFEKEAGKFKFKIPKINPFDIFRGWGEVNSPVGERVSRDSVAKALKDPRTIVQSTRGDPAAEQALRASGVASDASADLAKLVGDVAEIEALPAEAFYSKGVPKHVGDGIRDAAVAGQRENLAAIARRYLPGNAVIGVTDPAVMAAERAAKWRALGKLGK